MSETTTCPFCKEEIKAGALKCKNCGSMLQNISEERTQNNKEGTLWLPVPSFVLSLLCILTFADDSPWDEDTIFGVLIFAVTSLVLGIISVSTQTKGKGLAIAGIVLSSISILALLGIAVE